MRRRKIRRRKKSGSFLTTLLVVVIAFLFLEEYAPNIFSRNDSGFSTEIVGNTYYVSKNGDDSGNGSESNPFKTINRGIEELKPGDGLIIEKGVYEEKITLSKKGSRSKPFVLKAKGEVIIDGQGKGGTLLTIQADASYYSIEGFAFKNLYAFEAKGMCFKAGSNHIQVLECSFENIQTPHPSHKYNTANAVYFEGSGKTKETAIDNVLIKGGSAKNCGAGWSEVYSIDGNCTNIVLDGITITFTDIKGNIAICVCGNDPDSNRNPEVNRPQNVTIKNCIISGCKSPYGDDAYGVYIDGAYDVTVYGNKVSSSEGGIEVGSEHESSTFKGRETEKVVVEKNEIFDCKNAIYIGGFKDEGCGYAFDVTVTGNTISNSGDITLDKCNNVTLSPNGSSFTKTSRAEEVTIND